MGMLRNSMSIWVFISVLLLTAAAVPQQIPGVFDPTTQNNGQAQLGGLPFQGLPGQNGLGQPGIGVPGQFPGGQNGIPVQGLPLANNPLAIPGSGLVGPGGPAIDGLLGLGRTQIFPNQRFGISQRMALQVSEGALICEQLGNQRFVMRAGQAFRFRGTAETCTAQAMTIVLTEAY